MDPATIAMIMAAITAAGSVGGGYLSSMGQGKESKLQKTQRNTIDEILAGLKGQGDFADLYSMDQNAFQKSYVDPAKSMFNNQIAPNIQQQYIASGLQRGSGLDSALTRAGVDMDQMLNSAYMDYMQNVQNRKSNAMNSILGAGSGAAPGFSPSERLGQATGGYLSGDGFGESMNKIYDKYTDSQKNNSNYNYNAKQADYRPGFAGETPISYGY